MENGASEEDWEELVNKMGGKHKYSFMKKWEKEVFQ